MVKIEHRVVRGPLGSRVTIRRSSASGAKPGHIASHDEMRTSVHALGFPVRTLKEAQLTTDHILADLRGSLGNL